MGANNGVCCSERLGASQKAERKVSLANTEPDIKHDAARKASLTANEYAKRSGKSIGYHSQGADAEKFDKAFEANDLKAFVSLLGSTQAVAAFEERMHPWAQDPKTIGALSGAQLAMLASSNKDMRDEIRNSGAIKPLVGFLQSSELDRTHIGIVALSFLMDDNAENAMATYDAGAMPLLVKFLHSDISGLRVCIATALRNMAVEAEENKQELVKLGGIEGLVSVLSRCETSEDMIEGLLDLQDVLENPEAEFVPDFVEKFKKADGLAVVGKMAKSKDTEVKETAEDFLSALDG